ncbi:MAG: DNA topoisomerase IV subunit B [Erysipelotrichaceae bacterium]|nr:DNA topoisomerase IV subunit B [Erysipelotrichaceae bacterium]
MKNTSTNHYDESDIQILEGLEAVRKRPGMYIGSVDSRGLHHLIWEIVDNAVDEALAGYGKEIVVKVFSDNSVEVSDSGRGVPVGMHSSGKPTPEVVYTKLHAGGKFSSTGGYKTASGLHGVGASVVNALSEYMDVTIVRDYVMYQIQFAKGGKVKTPLHEIGKTSKKSGTSVHFKPDKTLFTTTNFSHTVIVERLRETAFLMPGISFVFIDESINKKEIFSYENGIVEFVKYNTENRNKLHDIIQIKGEDEHIQIDMAFVYTDDYTDDESTLRSYVNNVRTKDGGTHEIGLRSAMTKTFNAYADENGLLNKAKIKSLDSKDIREGVNIVLSVKIPEDILQFESQTKSKLGTPIARSVCENVIGEKLMYYLTEHKDVATLLVNKFIKAQQVREAVRKAREEARSGKKAVKQERIISDKLAPAQSKDSRMLELFLVEGDSAGGSAKQGRNSKYQAILPLRGKVINSEKQKLSDLLKNEEINTIIYTVGAGVGDDFDANRSNYDKIVIMTDADTDGAHIQVLLLTFFFRFMRGLIEQGKVYVALPPLYKVFKKTSKGEVFRYAWNDLDLAQAKKEIGDNAKIQRYKGLGEMNPEQLWETTMNPNTRSLLRVEINDFDIADRRLSTLMGDNAAIRRQWIEENVHFTLEDSFRKDDENNG